MPHGLSLADFDAVLFDIDGTLVDSLGMLVPGLADGIEEYAGVRPTDADIKSIVGLPMRVQIERYLSYRPTEEEMKEMTDYVIDRYEHYQDRETTFGPAVETLRLCRSQGLGTALVTSKNARELDLFLRRFSGADAVDATVCASDVRQPKPAAESALIAARKLDVSPERAILIGDSVYDLRCARNAGVRCVAVGYGAATTESLCAEKPDLYFDTPEDLLNWARLSFANRNASQESNHRFNPVNRASDTGGDELEEGAA